VIVFEFNNSKSSSVTIKGQWFSFDHCIVCLSIS